MTTVKAQERFVIVNNLRLRYLDWGAFLRLQGNQTSVDDAPRPFYTTVNLLKRMCS